MRPTDPGHWLYRLTPNDWLKAARNELLRAEEALVQKQQRTGVAGARRAAGMAWNAVLALQNEPDASYGRSYMDHLKALASDGAFPENVRESARALLEAPLKLELYPLGAGDRRLADCAAAILAQAEALVGSQAPDRARN